MGRATCFLKKVLTQPPYRRKQRIKKSADSLKNKKQKSGIPLARYIAFLQNFPFEYSTNRAPFFYINFFGNRIKKIGIFKN